MHKQLLFLILSLFHCLGYAQNVNYWQQKTDYKIDVQLDDTSNELHGYLKLNYTNNSPDTLTYIYFHLWPNAYKNDRTAFNIQSVENGQTDFYYAKPSERGYVDSLHFTIDDRTQDLIKTEHDDIVQVLLNNPLPPNSTIEIKTPFKVKIPLGFSRLGQRKQSYQITQWYPKPAVYDKNGWHPMPYLNQGEFYSEFGNYQVNITLPKNYVVMATGDLITPSETAYIDSLAQIKWKNRSTGKEFVLSDTSLKTITFKQDNVHDFAWFADKRLQILKDTLQLDTTYSIQIINAYLPENKNIWENSIEFVKDAVRFYSEELGKYPYATVKVIEGDLSAGGGMEYPTITIVQQMNNKRLLDQVIIHEVGHNWLYGIVANNERNNPWLDESINSYYEKKLMQQKYSSSENKLSIQLEDLLVLESIKEKKAQSLTLPSTAFNDANYGIDIYYKGALYFNYLSAYLGEANFKALMKQYYNDNKFRHVTPNDFKLLFENNKIKDVNWFFELINSKNGADFKIKRKTLTEQKILIEITNNSNLKLPAGLIFFNDKNEAVNTIWTAPFIKDTIISVPLTPHFTSVMIHPDIPDINPQNNLFKSNSSRLSLHPFIGLNNDYTTKNWITPVIGYNFYDGFMAGLMLHNLTLPSYKFTYSLIPMYGFNSQKINGLGMINYATYPDNNLVKSINYHIGFKTFSEQIFKNPDGEKLALQFLKISPQIVIDFKNNDARSTLEKQLKITGNFIQKEQFSFNFNEEDSSVYASKGKSKKEWWGTIKYTHSDNRTINPYQYTIYAESSQKFAKIAAEGNIRVDYFVKNKGLHIRSYIGKFISYNNSTDLFPYELSLTYNGNNDYLYEHTYLSRNENTGLLSQQIQIKEGGFKLPTNQYAQPLGMSNNLLFSLNIKTDLPFGNLPVRLFADIGTFSNAKLNNPSGNSFLYMAGIELYINKIGSLYIPILLSKDFQDYRKSILGKNAFLKTISFQLDFMNWDFKKPSKLLM